MSAAPLDPHPSWAQHAAAAVAAMDHDPGLPFPADDAAIEPFLAARDAFQEAIATTRARTLQGVAEQIGQVLRHVAAELPAGDQELAALRNAIASLEAMAESRPGEQAAVRACEAPTTVAEVREVDARNDARRKVEALLSSALLLAESEAAEHRHYRLSGEVVVANLLEQTYDAWKDFLAVAGMEALAYSGSQTEPDAA